MNSSRSSGLKFIMMIALGCLLTNAALSYDNKQCTRYTNNYPDTSGTLVSTTSFVTSTGDCAAIGMREQREDFIAVNSDGVMMDSARGHGEYLDVLAALSGCNDDQARFHFSSAVHQEFGIIYFTGPRAATSLEVSSRIDRIIESNSVLRRVCKVSG